MTEYWVSKKQYWCKYCNIWIRDDAPSRRQHETGLKHQGQKERFIRDLYKGGSQAKAAKIQEAADMARIDALASSAHAKDTHTGYTGKQSVLHAIQAAKAAASSSRLRPSEKQDKFANYSDAKSLGFDDEETAKTSYEIEQEIKGRGTNIGAWETVDDEPHGYYTPPPPGIGEAGPSDQGGLGVGVKRKLGEYVVGDEHAEHEDFKFEHKGKRPVRDPYDEDDWDPRTAFKSLKKKDQSNGKAEAVKQEGEGLKREEWTGVLELKPAGSERDGLVYRPGGGWVKPESSEESVGGDNVLLENGAGSMSEAMADQDVKPEVADEKPSFEETKPDISENSAGDAPSTAAAPVDQVGSLFKKRRPPPASRKK